MVYAVEYFEDGRRIQKLIGTVNKISFKKARKLAAKLLSENQIADQPAQTETSAKETRTQTVKRQSESSLTNDRVGQRQTKALEATNFSTKIPRKLVTFDELKGTYDMPLGRRQIDRLEAAGKFPKRVRIGERRVAWVASEVESYVEQRIAARGARPFRQV
ncbi:MULTISPECIES: AlpA family phage regulatory protein [unclassified Bradyrhizobium]|nr:MULTISPECIES: AlpA family phage regulatory protein [unclassified Bradyrhizobium]